MTRVFISYRRDDSADVTGRICDRLRSHFDQKVVFRDVDGITVGHDFRKVIRKAVEERQVLLAVIGPTWVNVANEDGARRLDNPHDFVRLEIETALTRDFPVIPVLVGRAGMPKAPHLPDSLRELAFRNGLEVRRDPDFHNDVDRLIRGLNHLLGSESATATNDTKRQEEELQADWLEYEEQRKKVGSTKPYLEKAAPTRLTVWEHVARAGQLIGMLLYGDCCEEGVGVPQDFGKAVEWYRNAAEQGYASAQNNLGAMYSQGLGISKDNTKAVEWYRKAAEQGNAIAQYNLATKYEKGEGVKRDQATAIAWYRKSAAQGEENAQKALARLGVN